MSATPDLVNFDAIPAELKKRTQWLCWRWETRKDKRTKPPYDAKTGSYGKSNDPTTWSAFDTTITAYRDGQGYSGIGFAFQNGDGLAGLDLDHVIDPATGEVDPRALEILDRFKGTYCEVSPSGTGYRIFLKGHLARTGKNEGPTKWLEAYDHTSPRYLTVTGHHWQGTASEVTEQQDALDWLHSQYFTKAADDHPHQQRTAAPDLGLDDTALIEKASNASNGAKFRDLWAGNTGAYGNDHSAADLALCSSLAFWAGPDPGRIDRLFRQSGLMRDKWNREDYRQRTIGKAIADCKEVYTGGSKARGDSHDTKSTPRRGANTPRQDFPQQPTAEAVMSHSNDTTSPDQELPGQPPPLGEPKAAKDAPAVEGTPITDYWPRLEADDKPPHIATDLANGYRVARDIGRDLLYVINIGWYAWDGTHWRRGEEFAYRKAHRLSRLILADAAAVTQKSADTEDGDHRQKLIGIAKALTGWAQVSESRDKVYAAMTLAKPMLAIEHRELDRDNWLLNCVNGVLDLRTGKMRPHRRDDFMTRCVPVAYDPQAKCPTWLAFLNRIFANTKDIIHFVQKVIGYSLTGDNSEQCVFFMHGSGQNGKSTLITAVQALMGAYAHQAAPDLLLASKHDRHPTELAELRGARLVTSVETGDSRRLNESLVKQMSGGDRMKGRFMRQDFFEFDPTHKVCLATNHKPIIRGTDYAIWRRIRLIPFTVAIPPEERDRKLPDKLKTELQGLLAWAVSGCLDWQREGLTPPQEVVKATDQYREEMDVLNAFFDECCVINKNATVAKGALYGAYKEWRDRSGERAETQRSFSNRMQERGFEEHKTTGGLRAWQGIGLAQVAQVAQVALIPV